MFSGETHLLQTKFVAVSGLTMHHNRHRVAKEGIPGFMTNQEKYFY